MKVLPNDCWSLGSAQHLSGRFPKVSIGITVGKGSETMNRKATDFPAADKLVVEKELEESRRSGTTENAEERQSQDQKGEGWISPKSKHNATSTAQKSLFANGVPELHSGEVTGHKDYEFSFGNKQQDEIFDVGKGPGTIEMNKQDSSAYQKKPSDVTKMKNESLRKKILEILGSNSQEKEAVHSADHDDAELPSQTNNQVGIQQQKPFSDPIETESETPGQVRRRYVTRSLTRKSAPKSPVFKLSEKIPAKKLFSTSTCRSKRKLENNIFAFADDGKWSNKRRNTRSHALGDKEKNSASKKCKVNPPKIHVPADNSAVTSKGANRHQKFSSVDKSSSRSREEVPLPREVPLARLQDSRESIFHKSKINEEQEQSQRDPVKVVGAPPVVPASGTHKNTSSSNMQMPSFKYTECPPRTDASCGGNTSSPLLDRNTKFSDDAQSPTLAMNASPYSQKKKSLHNDVSPIHQNILDDYESGSQTSVEEIESSEDEPETPVLEEVMSTEYEEEKESEEQPFLSPTEGLVTERFDVKRSTEGYNRSGRRRFNSGAKDACQKFKFAPTKPNNRGKKKTKKANLASPSPFPLDGTEDILESDDASDSLHEDSVTRTINQLAPVLEIIKVKIKSDASKRSSQILAAAAYKLAKEVRDVERRMQDELEKFITSGKSKRKQIESAFEEQQAKFQIMHRKFKDEVNQHLQVSKSSLKELDAHQMKLKRDAEKQKASHVKLLLRVEEAIGSELNDVETKIAKVHQQARRKLNTIKCMVKGCFDES